MRKPLEDLRGLRNFNPRSAVTKHLVDGQNPPNGLHDNGRDSKPKSDERPAQRPLSPSQRPPYDPDTT